MSLETDLIIDRRRLKRRLFVWRVVAIVAVLVAVGAVLARGVVPPGVHIARLSVSGIITEDERAVQALDRAATDPNVSALIVAIDSPGGSVAGGESLHDAIARVAAHKPVVAVMAGTAASAGYMIAVATDRIFARNATLTGSIGVILQTGEISGLLSRLGVTAEAITSGPLKDQPSLTKPLSDQGREVLHALVMDMYDQFVSMVAAGRHMDPTRVRTLADGRAYTGRQALALGLVDEIGDEHAARVWLADVKHVSRQQRVLDLATPGWGPFNLRASLGGLTFDVMKTLLSQRLSLDGAWALWQPDLPGS
jgi:protease-4